MADPTREELEALLRLQDLDTHLRQLQHRIDHLPEQAALDALSSRIREIDELAAAERVEADMIGAEVRRTDGDLSLLTQRLEADRLKLYGGEITHQRELQGLEAEIASVARRVEGAEEVLLEVMEKAEEIDNRLKEFAERRAGVADEEADLTAARDAAAQTILADRAETEVSRETEVALVPTEVLDLYDAKRAKFGGLGVGLLELGTCSACHMELPRADVNELKAEGNPLTSCPQCNRLLVVFG